MSLSHQMTPNTEMATMVCAICGKDSKDEAIFTVRTSWRQAGGTGVIPAVAWVHLTCDQAEQRRLSTAPSVHLTDDPLTREDHRR